MKVFYVTYRSLTKAQRARKELLTRSVRCELIRTPRQLQSGGCGYSLRLNESEFRKAQPLPEGYSRVFVQEAGREAEAVIS